MSGGKRSGDRPATGADTARAICLRGVFAMVGAVDVRFNEMQRDDLGGPWEELPVETRAGWLTLAALVDRAAHTTQWTGRIEPAKPPGFHAHLDVCQQCANHPHDLCPVGASLLLAGVP